MTSTTSTVDDPLPPTDNSVDFEAMRADLSRRSINASATKKACTVELGVLTSFTILGQLLRTATQFEKPSSRLQTSIYSSDGDIKGTITTSNPSNQSNSIDLLGGSGSTIASLSSHNKSSKKRQRDEESYSDEDERRIDQTLKAFEASVENAIVNEAKRILINLVSMKTEGTKCVQSYGLFHRRLRPTDPEKRLLLAVSFNAGVAIKLSVLKRVLGKSFTDGLLTTNEDVDGIGKITLPMTKEAEASYFFGNKPILLVTGVLPPPPTGSASEEGV